MEYIILIYILMSFYEWFLHRHVMHGDINVLKKIPLLGRYLVETAREHLEHHKHVNMDMTLKTHKQTTGVYFTWDVTLIFIIILTLSTTKIIPKYILFAAMAVCFHNLLWNNWHTRFHDYKHDIPFSTGLPKMDLFPTGYVYDTLWKYHTIHHSQKGEKYNFNIIFPMFDHIFGTYKGGSCVDNTEYCKKNHSDDRCYQGQSFCYSDRDILKS